MERRLLTFRERLWKLHVYVLTPSVLTPSVTWTKHLLIVTWEIPKVSIRLLKGNLGQTESLLPQHGLCGSHTFLIRELLVFNNHTYDAGIASNSERQDPEGGPPPRHWTSEGSYETIRIASPPLSPSKARPSQLMYARLK